MEDLSAIQRHAGGDLMVEAVKGRPTETDGGRVKSSEIHQSTESGEHSMYSMYSTTVPYHQYCTDYVHTSSIILHNKQIKTQVGKE